MPTRIFVNLPVRDLDRSMAFFRHLGFDFNPHFTDETAACMVVSDTIFAMLLTHPKFREFTPNPICDATTATEVLIALSRDNREDVDAMIRAAVEAGGTTFGPPRDYGFMYQHSFRDPDGHIWELFYMDPSAVPPQ
jgi:hypothetical protein